MTIEHTCCPIVAAVWHSATSKSRQHFAFSVQMWSSTASTWDSHQTEINHEFVSEKRGKDAHLLRFEGRPAAPWDQASNHGRKVRDEQPCTLLGASLQTYIKRVEVVSDWRAQ